MAFTLSNVMTLLSLAVLSALFGGWLTLRAVAKNLTSKEGIYSLFEVLEAFELIEFREEEE